MQTIRGLFFTAPKDCSLPEDCKITLTLAKNEPIEKSHWLSRIISYPFKILNSRIVKRIHNSALIALSSDFRGILSRNISPKRLISEFPIYRITERIIMNPAIMKCILKSSRRDDSKDGLFTVQNQLIFLSLFKDVFPNDTFTSDDALFTCDRENVHNYRYPMTKLMAPRKINEHTAVLQAIAGNHVNCWGKKVEEGRIHAQSLSRAYTTEVLFRLLLGHSETHDYLKIGNALITVENHYLLKKYLEVTISAEEEKKYQESLEIVRNTIEASLEQPNEKPILGSVVELMREKKMSDTQIKTSIYNLLLGASESAGDLLTYLLWQLGRHPEFQKEVREQIQHSKNRNDSASIPTIVQQLFTEAIRLFTPAYIVGRVPADDLVCTAMKEGKVLFRERIKKGEQIYVAPTFAGRNPDEFEKPNEFDPHRFEDVPKEFSWLPFGHGRHVCPGQWLARAEIAALVVKLIQKYEIKSYPEKEFKLEGNTSLKLPEDIWLKLSPVENEESDF